MISFPELVAVVIGLAWFVALMWNKPCRYCGGNGFSGDLPCPRCVNVG